MSTKTRTQQLRLEQERAAREKRIRFRVMIGVVGVVALALIGFVVWTVLGTNRQQPAASATGAQAAEIGAVHGDTLVLGKDTAPVTLDVYQDYMCPYCGQFERANRADLQQVVDDGTVRLVIHPLAFLDAQSSGTRYSSRAANAVVTVAQYQPDKLLAFNAILYEQQPAENSQGLSDDQIAQLARSVGVDDATISRFAAESNAGFVTSLTQAAFDGGIKGTPTVKINGKVFDGNVYAAGPLKAAVLSAAKGS